MCAEENELVTALKVYVDLGEIAGKDLYDSAGFNVSQKDGGIGMNALALWLKGSVKYRSDQLCRSETLGNRVEKLICLLYVDLLAVKIAALTVVIGKNVLIEVVKRLNLADLRGHLADVSVADTPSSKLFI